MAGIVYILKNECMPGIVKIGKTKRCPFERASELFTTGVPTPFDVVYAAWFKDESEAELSIHEHFDKQRINQGREFFRVDYEIAVEFLAQKAVYCETDLIVVSSDFIVDASDVHKYALVAGLHTAQMALALSKFLSDEAVQQAAAKYEEHICNRKPQLLRVGGTSDAC